MYAKSLAKNDANPNFGYVPDIHSVSSISIVVIGQLVGENSPWQLSINIDA